MKDIGLIRIDQVARLMGLKMGRHVYRLTKRPDFPKAVYLAGTICFWEPEAVRHWIRNRVREKPGPKPKR